VLDSSGGPILIRRGAVIAPFTYLVGPIAVGRDSQIHGDRVAASSIGDACRVHGEFSNCIVLGDSNKSHAGFVGHSYLGRWVNLGAMTTTSNLKNTYGPVQLWTPTGVRGTGQQFLGTFFGDHAKTGIGTMLSTGTVIGAGANVFGGTMPPKVVPPFAWGDSEPYDTYDVAKFLTVAERVMLRRHVELGDGARKQLAEAHKRRWSSR
jgi:UDP-N-acetylglucosamine diphosphorylase / glucose-1-phosphate thymidylyltransferase / UDP-N-acetylgalactosamine diphosphorylase / glucosamine-1-phosphate N-acetyltransferase / galactosamine-1-phosphate N-acetyltransferase